MKTLPWMFVVLVALATDACQSGGSPNELEIQSGPAVLSVVEEPFSIDVGLDGRTLVETANPPFRVGKLANPRPSEFVDPADPPAEVELFDLDSLYGWSREGDQLRLLLAGTAGTASVTIEPGPEGAFSLDWRLDRKDRVVFVEARLRASAAEHFYGLGEYFDTPDHTGRRRRLAFLVDTTIESGYNEVHVPVPALTSTAGWSVFVEDDHVGFFDVAATGSEVVSFAFATDSMRFHLVGAADPLQAVARVTDFTGRPRLPDPWTFAPMQWRNSLDVECTIACEDGCNPSVTGQDKALDDARAMRRHDIPGSCIWLDAPWMETYSDFGFNRVQFPDPTEMIGRLHALGFRVLAHAAPFIDNTDDSDDQCGVLPGRDAKGLFAHGVEHGYFVSMEDGSPWILPWRNGAGALVDFTNPEAMDWWKEMVLGAVRAGIEGFKCDWDEYVVPYIDMGGAKASFPFLFADGSDERTMHARYSTLFHESFREVLDEEGLSGFIISRAGNRDDPPYSTAIWPGDLDSDLSTFRATDEGFGESCQDDPDCREGLLCSNGNCVHKVGGLRSALMAAQSLSASGFPFFASDTGGFRHGAPTSETLLRWAEFSALGPHMQLGGGGNSHNPWDFSESDFDEQTLEVYRRYARLHTDLFPTFYALSAKACDQGVPVIRPMGLAFPDDQQAIAAIDQFMVGEHLLAAPVIEAGATSRRLYLPAGAWVHWFTGEPHQGPARVEVDAPLDSLPLFLCQGAIVALGHPEIDTLAPATDPDVTSLDDLADWLKLKLFPHGETSLQLADGTLLVLDDSDGIAFSADASPLERTWRIEILRAFDAGPPSIVTLNGEDLARVDSPADLDQAEAGWAHQDSVLHARFRRTEVDFQAR